MCVFHFQNISLTTTMATIMLIMRRDNQLECVLSASYTFPVIERNNISICQNCYHFYHHLHFHFHLYHHHLLSVISRHFSYIYLLLFISLTFHFELYIMCMFLFLYSLSFARAFAKHMFCVHSKIQMGE